MLKLFVSLPMKDKTEGEIRTKQKELLAEIKNRNLYADKDIVLINTFLNEDAPKGLLDNQIGLWYLGKSLELLAQADIAIFATGWARARGCVIEHQACISYGIDTLYE